MKRILKNLICISLLFINTMNAINSCCKNKLTKVTKKQNHYKCYGKTFFSERPQDSNVARRMVGLIDKYHDYNEDENRSLLNLDVSYRQNFKNNRLAQLFSFTGFQKQSYGPTCNEFDVYSINLGTTVTGTFNYHPEIKNFIVDIDIISNWNKLLCGLWTRFNIPFVYSRRELNLQESCVDLIETPPFKSHLVTTKPGQSAIPFPDIKRAFEIQRGFGAAPELIYGKIHEKRHDTQIAGLHFEVGYDFYKTEKLFLSAGLHIVAPTGTKPNAEFLFEPICGANHQGQFGGTFQAGYNVWQNCDGQQNLSLYFDSVITHLFKSKQRRLCGLYINGKSSPGSSYLLLKKYDLNGDIIGLERAANILACELKIKNNIMADLALLLQYDFCNISSGLGLNFWYRSKDNAERGCCKFKEWQFKYANKGNSLANNNISQSKSTIGKCSADDPAPVYLTSNDIDCSLSLNPHAFSNKIFGFASYTFDNCKALPFVLVEGEVEFGHKNFSTNMWGVMIKLGMTF